MLQILMWHRVASVGEKSKDERQSRRFAVTGGWFREVSAREFVRRPEVDEKASVAPRAALFSSEGIVAES